MSMNGMRVLGSFMKGFRRTSAPDIINALFVAKTLSDIDLPFNFENRDNNGVDSVEIRKLLFFNGVDLEREVVDEHFLQMGKKLRELPSKELKWMAQFVLHGKVHLFDEEARKAKELIAETKEALDAS